MKIAILGAGMVGATLGRRFAGAGHEVFFGVPEPAEHEDKKAFAAVGTVGEAARAAEIILLAVPFGSIGDAIERCGDLAGKILVDCTNPLRMADGKLGLTLGFDDSAAEKVAALAPGARVVKCFNQTGFDNMANPAFAGGRAVQFVCGDDSEARETVANLAGEIGFDAVDAGELKTARLLEPFAMLWIHLAMTTGLGRDFAFAILRR
ncbi:MAG: NADPH-dependent F420 reductase [Acidobacteria bacterium]|nr:NADPH-dependent F420 reductase [Acidobacteriota bacterium]